MPYVPAGQLEQSVELTNVPGPQTQIPKLTAIRTRPEPPLPAGELSAPPPPPLPVLTTPSSEAALTDPLYPFPPPPIPPGQVFVAKLKPAVLQQAPPPPPPATKLETATVL